MFGRLNVYRVPSPIQGCLYQTEDWGANKNTYRGRRKLAHPTIGTWIACRFEATAFLARSFRFSLQGNRLLDQNPVEPNLAMSDSPPNHTETHRKGFFSVKFDSVASLPKHCSISPQRRGGRGENLEKTLRPLRLGGELTVISHNRCEYISPNLCENPTGREF
jgi:hypothetical protein